MDRQWKLGGDRPVEFSPKRLLVYLRQLSTTNNLESHPKEKSVVGSQQLDIIPIENESFGKSYREVTERCTTNRVISNLILARFNNELDFDFKIDWENGRREKLDNHGLPIDLVLEIKYRGMLPLLTPPKIPHNKRAFRGRQNKVKFETLLKEGTRFVPIR